MTYHENLIIISGSRTEVIYYNFNRKGFQKTKSFIIVQVAVAFSKHCPVNV